MLTMIIGIILICSDRNVQPGGDCFAGRTFGDVAMIIQTGMRTDIPAFYSEWLMNRIQEGFVLVRNPYNPTQVTKYSLSSAHAAWIP